MNFTLKLNARFQPIHRFELEDALQEILETRQSGEVTGGGTVQKADGEIEYCEINIHLCDSNSDSITWLTSLLHTIGIPKGSVLQYAEQEINVGSLEGLACYLNGRDLSPEIYQTCDINYAIEQLELAMKGIGRMYSYWEGNAYTALYFYGTSYREMKEKITTFIDAYPLCQKCRVVQIA